MQKKARKHLNVVTEEVEKYLNKIQRARDPVLLSLEKDAEENDVPILGPLVGNFLSIIVQACNAKNVLEVGTATGYSGIWLARATSANSGKLTTIEMDPDRKKIAERAFVKAGLINNVEMILGDAGKEVPEIAQSRPGQFDLVFMDVGDKKLYEELIDSCIRALKTGGLFIADDTLYRGVAIPSVGQKKTKTMRKFNKIMFADERLKPSIIPLGDGLTVAVKISD
ncbi:MAG: O-methyltransferase [Thaumarchaeota archaeon]|nr:O-methyltransferase [Nitrososphaerota archaeon]